jgi:putative ABC transport system substrate-binding protein
MILRVVLLMLLATLGSASGDVADARDGGAESRIGFLTPNRQLVRETAFRDELKRLGYVDGKSIVIDYRSADDDFERLHVLAAELAERKVDVIVAVVTQASIAARRTTDKIPIVMVGVSDPVASGLVANLARPGGNVTGTSTPAGDVVAKQMQLVRELVPSAARVAVLANPANAVFHQQQLKEAQAAATQLGLNIALYEARLPDTLERIVDEISKARIDVMLVLADPMLSAHAQRIANAALRHRLPTIGASRAVAEAGMAVAYGPDYTFGYRRAAVYVDRILKGAKPGDLPVEQSTRFELVVNRRTLQALGAAVPPSLAARADDILR